MSNSPTRRKVRLTSRGRSALLAATGLLLWLAVAIPGQAGAFRLLEGRAAGKWPGKKPVITYFVAAGFYGKAVDSAAAAWNATGVRFRLVEAKSRKRAEVIVRYLGGDAHPTCADFGYGGPVGSGQPGSLRYFAGNIFLPRIKASSPTCQTELIGLVAHEFGHVLGLGHENRTCALMNRTRINGFWPEKCPAPPDGQWRCRVIELDDARGAQKLYGGKLRPPVTPENCPIPGYVAPDDDFKGV